MEKFIKELLEDLYAQEPELKQQEANLRKIIELALAARPQAVADDVFKRRLKAQLLSSAEGFAQQNKPVILQLLTNIFDMKKVAYFAGGAVLTALLVVPVLNYINNAPITRVKSGVTITKVQKRAFGNLSVQNQEGISTSAKGLGGGGGGAPQAESTTAVDGAGGDSKMIFPADFVNYNYVYKGDDITLDQQTAAVLKRIKQVSAGDFASILNRLDLGMINLSSFNSAKLQNISFVQDNPWGYAVSVSLDEGLISLYENWRQWPQCTDPACWERQQFRPENLPADEEIINIANAFVQEHQINLDNYGEPTVMHYWKRDFELMEDKSQYFVGNMLTVLYPLIIDGKEVYEADGINKTGLMVNVNLTHKRVSGVSNIMVHNYQSSDYALASLDKIMSAAQKGGMYSWSYPEATKTVDVEIGTPTLQMVKIWNYNQGANDELLVPALVFPIISQPSEPYFYRQAITVPIVEDLLNQTTAEPPVYIMERSVDPALPTPTSTTDNLEAKQEQEVIE